MADHDNDPYGADERVKRADLRIMELEAKLSELAQIDERAAARDAAFAARDDAHDDKFARQHAEYMAVATRIADALEKLADHGR